MTNKSIKKLNYLNAIFIVSVINLGCITDRAFADAILKERHQEIKKIIADGRNVNSEIEYYPGIYDLPLHLALKSSIKSSNFDIPLFLLDAGANVNSISPRSSDTPLHIASEAGNENLVLIFLNAGANINVRDKKGHTPLLYAASRRNRKMTLFLIERGADVSLKDSEGLTIEAWLENELRYLEAVGQRQTISKVGDINILKSYLAFFKNNLTQRRPVLFRAKITNIIGSAFTIGSNASGRIRMGVSLEFQNEFGNRNGNGVTTEIFHTNIKGKVTSGNPQKGDYAIIYEK